MILLSVLAFLSCLIFCLALHLHYKDQVSRLKAQHAKELKNAVEEAELNGWLRGMRDERYIHESNKHNEQVTQIMPVFR